MGITPNQREFDHAVLWAKEQRKLNHAAHVARVNGFRRGAGRMYALRAKAEREVIGVATRALAEAVK
jgi:hypothetical protein